MAGDDDKKGGVSSPVAAERVIANSGAVELPLLTKTNYRRTVRDEGRARREEDGERGVGCGEIHAYGRQPRAGRQCTDAAQAVREHGVARR
ncbi:hypothetical protein ACP70R_037057 [Stipagrostis hirtigluma subsp. patula]